MKHWKQFQKEIIAVVSGAIPYHMWRARKWKKFNISMQREEVVTQFKELIMLIETLYILS